MGADWQGMRVRVRMRCDTVRCAWAWWPGRAWASALGFGELFTAPTSRAAQEAAPLVVVHIYAYTLYIHLRGSSDPL